MRYRSWLLAGTLSLALSMFVACDPKQASHDDHEGHGHEGHKEESHDDHEGHGEHEGHGHEEEDGHGEGGTVHLSPDALKRVEIEVAPAELRNIAAQIRTTARVAYDETRIAHVGPRIPGRVQEVSKRLGETVEKGDALATLDSVDLGETIAEHRAAGVEEELARKTLERERTLLAEKLSSEQQVIEAEAAHEKALAAKRAAAERLRLYGGRGARGSYFKLRAPIDGKIVQMHLALGELVTPEDKVYTIADLSALWIWVDIFERDLGKVHVGDDATVHTEAYGSEKFVGKVAYIMDEVDPDSRTVRARIDIDNPHGKLKPGMFADVTVTDPHSEAASEREVIAIPPGAIQRDGDSSIVFVKVGDGEFQRRTVEVGTQTLEYAEIVSGVKSGEEVVTKGGFLLKSESEKGTMGGGHSH